MIYYINTNLVLYALLTEEPKHTIAPITPITQGVLDHFKACSIISMLYFYVISIKVLIEADNILNREKSILKNRCGAAIMKN